jgi:hypothetical protein
MNIVNAGALLTPGILADAARLYADTYTGIEAELGDVTYLGATSDKLQEIRAYLQTAPYPQRWDRGTTINSETMTSVQFTIPNQDWGSRIYFHDNDVQDDQTSSLYEQARQLGRHFATLVERVFYQVLQNTTDPKLLPTVPNAADGTGLYSGSARFGVATGNQFSTTGQTVAAVMNDIFTIKQTLINYQDTQSQPLWDPSQINKNGYKLFYGPSLTLVMSQALKAAVVPIGANTTTSNAGISNFILSDGTPVYPVINQRITGNSFYAWMRGLSNEKRCFVKQARQGFFESIGNWETSDHTRDTGELYIQYKDRTGYGLILPLNTVKAV